MVLRNGLEKQLLNDERRLHQEILDNASARVATWPDWKRSPDVLDTLTALKKEAVSDSLEVRVVADEANSDWRDRVLNAIYSVAKKQKTFTAADIWSTVDSRAVGDPRQLGPILQLASRKGICRSTKRVRKSTRVESHRRPMTIWASHIFEEWAIPNREELIKASWQFCVPGSKDLGSWRKVRPYMVGQWQYSSHIYRKLL